MLKPIAFIAEESIIPDTDGCICVGCNGQGAGNACDCGTKNGGGAEIPPERI